MQFIHIIILLWDYTNNKHIIILSLRVIASIYIILYLINDATFRRCEQLTAVVAIYYGTTEHIVHIYYNNMYTYV